jgi:hypothetical protein
MLFVSPPALSSKTAAAKTIMDKDALRSGMNFRWKEHTRHEFTFITCLCFFSGGQSGEGDVILFS